MATPTLSKTQLQAAAACIMGTLGLYENDRYGKLVPIYDYCGDIAAADTLFERMVQSIDWICLTMVRGLKNRLTYRVMCQQNDGLIEFDAFGETRPLAITRAFVLAARRGWLGTDVQARVEAVIAKFERGKEGGEA